MYIAYSALRATKNGNRDTIDPQLVQRYQAYRATCRKYQHQIAAIQKYMPGWIPPFERKA